VNNLRDVDGDRVAGKRTLAVRLGARFAQAEFAACVLGAAAVPVVLWLGFAGPPLVLLATGACVLSLPSLRAVAAWRTGARLTSTLAATGRLLVVYAAAFSLGWAL
jgi:1,4-dihydroxy-2-naphthoate octaprenyltransferase